MVVKVKDTLQSPLSLKCDRSRVSIPHLLPSPYHRATPCLIFSYWVGGKEFLPALAFRFRFFRRRRISCQRSWRAAFYLNSIFLYANTSARLNYLLNRAFH